MFRNVLRLSLALGIFALPMAQAAPLWVGTADYKAGPNGDLADGETVGDFDSYDFAVGVALLEDQDINNGGNPQNPQSGDVYNGYFQTYVTGHQLGTSGVDAPHLDITGSNLNKYELTIAGMFEETITGVDGSSVDFDITGGSAALYLDASPDYNFGTDTGFNDTGAILSGTVIGGTGTLLTTGQFGVTSIEILVSSFDTAVYDPDTIHAGSSVFTLQLGPGVTDFLSGVNRVQGHSFDGTDLRVSADGNLTLFAVPEPLSLLLVGSAAVGLVVIRRRGEG